MNLPNPYNYNLPVKPEMFFGRQADLTSLLGHVTVTPGDSIALVGGRRMGKTSLLEALWRELASMRENSASPLFPLPVFLDFTGAGIADPPMFFHAIAQETETLLADLVSSLPAPFHLVGGRPPAPAFGRWLVTWEQVIWREQARRLRLVLLLDECEQIVHQPWAGDLHGALRSILVASSTRSLLKVVMAGSHRFLLQVRQHGSPLRNILVYHPLAVLDVAAVRALTEQPTNLILADDVVGALYHQGGGHPFLSQYLLQNAWEKGLDQVTIQDIQAIAAAFSYYRHDFQDWMTALGKAAWPVYTALMKGDGTLTETAIRQELPLLAEETASMLNALCYHGLVTHEEDRYRITANMFRTWFANQTSEKTHLSQQVDRGWLRQAIDPLFDKEDLKMLCFDLGIDYESLPGEGKAGKTRELIAFCERNGRIQELLLKCKELRPHIDWPIEE